MANLTAAVSRQIEETPERFRKLRKVVRKYTARMVQKMLPAKVLAGFQQCRQYQGMERLLYLKIRLMYALGSKPLPAPTAARSFLFVCFGNIMRSPMCEALLNLVLSKNGNNGMTVISAGLNATLGTPAHPWAIAAAEKFGVSLQHHQARLLTRQMVERADVIFAMDYQNEVQLLSRYPEAKNKVFMLSAYGAAKYSDVEIHDPYYLGSEGTLDCYQILETCIKNLAASITRSDAQR